MIVANYSMYTSKVYSYVVPDVSCKWLLGSKSSKLAPPITFFRLKYSKYLSLLKPNLTINFSKAGNLNEKKVGWKYVWNLT